LRRAPFGSDNRTMEVVVEAIPVDLDAHGVYRVGGPRHAGPRGARLQLRRYRGRDRAEVSKSAVARRLPSHLGTT
jgi:hypothetical protein